MGQQLKYAERRGFRLALIAGASEFEAGVVQVKDLVSGEKKDVPNGKLVEAVRAVLEGGPSRPMAPERRAIPRDHHAPTSTSRGLGRYRF